MIRRLLRRIGGLDEAPLIRTALAQDPHTGTWRATFTLSGSRRPFRASFSLADEKLLPLRIVAPDRYEATDGHYRIPPLLEADSPLQVALHTDNLGAAVAYVPFRFEAVGWVFGGTIILASVPIGTADTDLLDRYFAQQEKRYARWRHHAGK